MVRFVADSGCSLHEDGGLGAAPFQDPNVFFASAIAHEIAKPATFISGIVADLKRFRGQAAPIPARRAGEDETDVIDETMEDVVPMRASAPI